MEIGISSELMSFCHNEINISSLEQTIYRIEINEKDNVYEILLVTMAHCQEVNGIMIIRFNLF